MSPEKPQKLIFPPETTFYLGPSLDSELLIPTQSVEGTKGETNNGWQKVEVVLKPGEKPLVLYQATALSTPGVD